MLIICEGADGGGKSTLALRLHDRLRELDPNSRVEMWRKGPPTRHPLDEYERPLYDYVPGGSRHIVCDRWHLGEHVYPEVFGRTTLLDRATATHIDLFLRSRGALVVHVDPGARETHRRLVARGDDLVTPEMLTGVISRFRAVVDDRQTLPVYRYPGGSPTNWIRDGSVDHIIEHARAVDDEVAHLAPFVTYVGPPAPDILLLGDVRHNLRYTAQLRSAESTREHGPAFGPYRGTSGHFLLTHLPSPDRIGPVGLANACDSDDPVALVEALGGPRVVALGSRTLRQLSGRMSLLGSAPHPQFVRRFFNHSGSEYGEVVARAARGEVLLGWRPANTWLDRPVAASTSTPEGRH